MLSTVCMFYSDTMASSAPPRDLAKDYKLMRLIGTGCSDTASIFLAKHSSQDSHVAIKIFNLDELDQANMDLSLVQHELVMSRQLQHENIMTSQYTFTTQRQIWSVMPICGYGACKDLLCAHFAMGLPEAAIAYILYYVIKALEYLHSCGVIHRSVKASHILISNEGHVCLSGLRHSYSMVENGVRNNMVHDFPDHYLKSLLWTAPEILQQNAVGYNTSSDIYSLGITACEIANAAVPFADTAATHMLLDKLKGVFPRLWDSRTLSDGVTASQEVAFDENDPMLPYTKRTFSSHFHDFLEACLGVEAHLRPTCSELLQHSFFKHVRRKVGGASTLPELLLPVQPILDILKNLGDEITQEADDVNVLAGELQQAALDGGWNF